MRTRTSLLLARALPAQKRISQRQLQSSFFKQKKYPANHKQKQNQGHPATAHHYYNLGLAAIVCGGAGYLFGLGYEATTGELRKKIEHGCLHLWPPAVPGDIIMMNPLDEKTCLPIPQEIFNTLHCGILSAHRDSNTLMIFGEGGIGKFDLALNIAYLLNNQSKKQFKTIVGLNGHTKESTEQGIIDIAKRLGMKDNSSLVAAKSFLKTELLKRHTVIIVRCLREEAMINAIFPLQDVVNGITKPDVTIIYTTGQNAVAEKAKKHKFYQVSLNQSYTVNDLLSYIKSLPTYASVKNEIKAAIAPLFVNQILNNNPALARMAIAYLENTNTSLFHYIESLKTESILQQSLRAINNPLASTLLKKIAALPQDAISIDDLVNIIQENSQENSHTTYQNVAKALEALAVFRLVRVDPIHNCVYPLMLVWQASAFLTDHQKSNAAKRSYFWQDRSNRAKQETTAVLTQFKPF